VVEDAKREWKFEEGCQIMRVNPEWFVDERSLELVETYLFHRPNAASAFPGTLGDQPVIWINAKLILDGVFGTGLF
jgi:hypothetical protein